MFWQWQKGKSLVLVLGMIILLLIGCTSRQPANSQTVAGNPDDRAKLQLLDSMAEEVYREADNEAYEAARLRLQDIRELVTKVQFSGVTSLEGVKALTDTVLEAERSLTAVKLSRDTVIAVTAKLRFAADALTHPNDPMWQQYYKVLTDDIHGFELAAQSKKIAEMSASLASFNRHYEVIKPALQIARDPAQITKLDSFLGFLQTQLKAKSLSYDTILGGIKLWHDSVDDIFGKKDANSAYMPMEDERQSILISLGLGFFIVMVLTYSAWRMFPAKSASYRIDRRDDL